MYSIKPGRFPSWGGVVGGCVAVLFGMFWLRMASSIGAPSFFLAFGSLFVLVALGKIIYHFYNAVASRRISEYDIEGPTGPADLWEGQAPRAPRRRREFDVVAFNRAADLFEGRSPRRVASPARSPLPQPAPSASSQSVSASPFCTACGSKLQSHFAYCPQCGAGVVKQSAVI